MTSDDDATAATSSGVSVDCGTPLPRRAFLASGAAAFLGSGCVQQSQSLFDRSAPKRASVTIKTVPADADRTATTIARYLARQLGVVGVDARIALRSREELYRDVLLNQSFDLYVARFPHAEEPDFLRSLLHSRFSGETGWQNPFGYTNIELDDQLETQRNQTGLERGETLREIERTIARDQPFTVVAFPETIRTARVDRVQFPRNDDGHTALRYLGAESATDRPEFEEWAPTEEPEDADAAPERGLRATVSDARITENLNPLAIEFRNRSTITDLLYDSLGRWVAGDIRPWLAREWEWEVASTDGPPRATITLREDLTWHDGTQLTAADVEFSYRFLGDTSLGRGENPAPAPNYRDETSLVDSVEAQSDERVVVQFLPVSRRVAARALTVPVLPEHVWEKYSKQATIAGVDTSGSVTRALVWNNVPPLGSGPLQFEAAKTRESLLLRRFDEHFLHRGPTPEELRPYAGGFAFDTLKFAVVPSSAVAVELVASGAAEVTRSPLLPDDIPQIGRLDDLELQVDRPNAFYHVGYNTRGRPTSNSRFRRAVAHLLDKSYLVEEVFASYADPAASPLARHPAHASELRWTGRDPATPFPGDDGELDVERARKLFREAGYRYSKEGNLLTRR